MADTDSNAGSSYPSLPDYKNHYSAMSAELAHLNFSHTRFFRTVAKLMTASLPA